MNAVIPVLWPADENGLSLPCDSPPLVLWISVCALSHHQINSSSPESSQGCCGTFIPIKCVIAFAYIYIFFSRIRTTGTLIEQGALGEEGLPGRLVNIRTSLNRATWKWCYVEMKKVMQKKRGLTKQNTCLGVHFNWKCVCFLPQERGKAVFSLFFHDWDSSFCSL